jgi:hypothetical protein
VSPQFNWLVDEGQSYAPYFGYIPLPEPVVEQAKAALARFAQATTGKAGVVLDKVTASPSEPFPQATPK